MFIQVGLFLLGPHHILGLLLPTARSGTRHQMTDMDGQLPSSGCDAQSVQGLFWTALKLAGFEAHPRRLEAVAPYCNKQCASARDDGRDDERNNVRSAVFLLAWFPFWRLLTAIACRRTVKTFAGAIAGDTTARDDPTAANRAWYGTSVWRRPCCWLVGTPLPLLVATWTR